MPFFITYWKVIVIGLLLVAVAGSAYAFKAHYDRIVLEREQFKSAYEQAENNHNLTKGAFDTYRSESEQAIATMEAAIQAVTSEYALEREKSNVLGKKLAKHDLTTLAKKKPNLISTRINIATASLFKSLEQATSNSAYRGESANSPNGIPPP